MIKNIFQKIYLLKRLYKIRKIFAFTLAEMLIVIGIIGVVSALTIPNLNSSTNNAENVARAKKFYSNINDAFNRAQAKYGPFSTWFINDTTDNAKVSRMSNRITEFLRVKKSCGCTNAATACINVSGEYNCSFILSDNTAVAFLKRDRYLYSEDVPLYIVKFDIDGPNKGKNYTANDRFDIYITEKSLNSGAYRGSANSIVSITPSGNYTLHYANDTDYALAWILKNGNMDYLKCSDLNWDTKTTCK